MTGLLRRELGFDGLIYTDSMAMAGDRGDDSPGDAAVRAIKAGNDVVAALAGRRGGGRRRIKAAVSSGRDPDGAGSTLRSSAC